MASVAICPHCYLQLVVPDGVEPGERVECPTCAKEFGLDQAVLRPIPEVVRRSQAVSVSTSAAAANDIVEEPIDITEEIDEIIVEERILEAPQTVERDSNVDAARYIEEVKARIESDIAAGGLLPGSNAALSLDLPDVSIDSAEPEEETTTSPAADDPLATFRNAKTVAEIPAFEDKIDLREEISLDVEIDDFTDKTDEPVARAETALDNTALDNIEEPVPELDESRAPQPTVRTLADWMPSREEVPEQDSPEEQVAAEVESEIEEVVEDASAALGPSFDLPNVPLVPRSGATVEFDPSMSFGPAAETEFELDDVNFASVPAEEHLADDLSDDVAEESEPVFPESKSELPAAPFVLPGVPRARKKRSIVRVLMGTALGALVGLGLGYFVLLYVLGPEGDLLRIAQYIPSAILPKSFAISTSIANAPLPPTTTPQTSTPPVDVASDDAPANDDESANVPAGYVEETTESSPLVGGETQDDDRYGTEPAPLEEPAAEPIEGETSISATPLSPLPGPTITVDELAKALEAAKTAQPGLVEGDLSDAAVRRTKGASYEKLAELAEALTFVDASSPSFESENATSGALQVFGEVLASPHTRDEIARIVTIWIPSPHRKNSGIFFAGTAEGGQIAGDVYEYQVTTDEGGKYPLLCREPLETALADSDRPIGVVGAIVDRPAENVKGYHGTAERAIWLTRAIPLD